MPSMEGLVCSRWDRSDLLGFLPLVVLCVVEIIYKHCLMYGILCLKVYLLLFMLIIVELNDELMFVARWDDNAP